MTSGRPIAPSRPPVRAIVPAGGAGTRLWPMSRTGRPKFLLDLTGSGRSLLQATVDRLEAITGPGGVVVVTGRAHAEAVHAQLPGLGDRAVLAEPSPRDSMAAIGLAAALLLERDGEDVVVGSFAADHVIGDVPAFTEAVRQAVVAAQAGYVVTVGIRATAPSTAFGYVHLGESLRLPGAPEARAVQGFTEKPDRERAEAYLATGEYRWNAGMFVVRARVLLDHLARHQPTLAAGVQEIAAAWDGPGRAEVLERVWPGLTRIAIDHAIAEPVAAEGGVAVVPGDFPWDDVGDFASLTDVLAAADVDGARGAQGAQDARVPGSAGVRVLGDPSRVLARDAVGGLVVTGTARTVAVLGTTDVVVVDTEDALLVTTREHAQDVKVLVDALRAAGREDLL